MSKLLGGTALLATALLMTACTGEIMNSGIDRHGVPKYFSYAASKGEVSTTIVGNPFQTSKAQVDQTILASWTSPISVLRPVSRRIRDRMPRGIIGSFWSSIRPSR